jgi:hypothetical protein
MPTYDGNSDEGFKIKRNFSIKINLSREAYEE